MCGKYLLLLWDISWNEHTRSSHPAPPGCAASSIAHPFYRLSKQSGLIKEESGAHQLQQRRGTCSAHHGRKGGGAHNTPLPLLLSAVPGQFALLTTHCSIKAKYSYIEDKYTNPTYQARTMRTATSGAYFLAGCMVAATVLQSSPAGAFAPPSFLPATRSSFSASGCRACCDGSLGDRPHRSQSRRPRGGGFRRTNVATRMSSTDIESPFATPGMADMGEEEDKDALLPLTLENVETVLDEMRPYLMSDG